MKNDSDILTHVYAGYNGAPNSGLWSSPVWMAHEAGQAMARHGYSQPIAARTSRGCSVRVQTAANEFVIKFSGDDLAKIQIERKG